MSSAERPGACAGPWVPRAQHTHKVTNAHACVHGLTHAGTWACTTGTGTHKHTRSGASPAGPGALGPPSELTPGPAWTRERLSGGTPNSSGITSSGKPPLAHLPSSNPPKSSAFLKTECLEPSPRCQHGPQSPLNVGVPLQKLREKI